MRKAAADARAAEAESEARVRMEAVVFNGGSAYHAADIVHAGTRVTLSVRLTCPS